VASNWFCYLLRCADDTLYCGITNDLAKRLAAHNAGTASKYTRVRLPVELAYAEPCADKSSALKREMQIKKMPRSAKLALCKNDPVS
jgi:putative endonuclease